MTNARGLSDVYSELFETKSSPITKEDIKSEQARSMIWQKYNALMDIALIDNRLEQYVELEKQRDAELAAFRAW
jgi:hypothetical protein